jgi:uncharacterized protein YndB with AHSA1/START domain
MPSAQNSVTINRSVADVFAYVTDGEKCTEWRSGVMDIRRTNGDGSVGTTYEQGVKGPMGRRIAADYMVTAYEPNRRYEFQTITGPARPHGRYDFEATDDGGTRLTFALDAELGGLRGLLMGGIVQKTMDSEVRAIERIKKVLEAEQSASAEPPPPTD